MASLINPKYRRATREPTAQEIAFNRESMRKTDLRTCREMAGVLVPLLKQERKSRAEIFNTLISAFEPFKTFSHVEKCSLADKILGTPENE